MTKVNFKELNPAVPFRGGKISIQASEFHYSTPKNDKGPYSQYEVGAWDTDGHWLKLPELREDNQDTVYGYIDKDKVVSLLKSDGYSDNQIKNILP
jgi:hypothetical protein